MLISQAKIKDIRDGLMEDAAVTQADAEVFLSHDHNLRIASGKEIVRNAAVELLRCQASRQKVPASAGDIVL